MAFNADLYYTVTEQDVQVAFWGNLISSFRSQIAFFRLMFYVSSFID